MEFCRNWGLLFVIQWKRMVKIERQWCSTLLTSNLAQCILQALCLNKIWGLWQKDWFSVKQVISATFWQLALNNNVLKMTFHFRGIYNFRLFSTKTTINTIFHNKWIKAVLQSDWINAKMQGLISCHNKLLEFICPFLTWKLKLWNSESCCYLNSNLQNEKI